MISIVIVTYNNEDTIVECLESIYKSNLKEGIEITVIDNHSYDLTVELVKKKFTSVILIVNSVNIGFAKANNIGIKKSKGRYILLLNPDTVIFPDTIEKTTYFMDKNSKASIVGCRTLTSNLTLQFSYGNFPALWRNFLYQTIIIQLFLPFIKKIRCVKRNFLSYCILQETIEVDYVGGAFMMIRREVFSQIGLLDERFFMFAEEVDFCYRAKKANLSTFFYPNACIIHKGGSETASIYKYIVGIESVAKYFEKHFSPLQRALYVIIMFIGSLMHLIVWSLIYLLGKGKNKSLAASRVQLFSRAVGYHIGKIR